MNFKNNSKIFFLLALVIVSVFVLYFAFFGGKVSSLGTRNTNELVLDTITINIQGGDFSYIKADLSLAGNTQESSEKMQNNRVFIRRMMIDLLAQQNGRDLMKEKNKIKLKNQIKKAVEESVGVHVKDVYFRNFVLAP